MKRFVTPLLASVALCAAAIPLAHAEIDVARLKTAIETSLEADYPTRSIRRSTPTPKSPLRK
jgi:hypothetical protein